MRNLTNLTQVQSKNLRMVFFSSVEESNKATQIEELRTMPWSIGPCSLIVPAKIVPLFKSKGLKIQVVLNPINKADLTSEQHKDMKNREALVWTSRSAHFFMDKELASWLGNLLEKTYPRRDGFSHAKKETSKV